MLFDKPLYLLFLALVTFVYWRLPWRGQNRFLLVASYVFYGWWDLRFLGLMAASTLVDYTLAVRIDRAREPATRRAYLVLSLAMNFAFLGCFKYCDFFIDSLAHVAALLGLGPDRVRLLAILLPPGISFYTFQAVAYMVDVYQRKLPPARSLVDYALFISLFPHLIAGPIQRPSHLLPQLQAPRELDRGKVFDGLMLIVTGLFRKCVIADNCALLANAVFDGRFGHLTLPVVLIGVYAFAWQIYGDFSGYSDIARGSAQLLGFHFAVNFRQPYLATTLSDFWRRWHISLSTWLREYLYIALGGNRRGERRTYANLLTTMLLGGLWHGANWTFVLWGGLHGLGLAVARWRQRGRGDAPLPLPVAAKGWPARVAIFHFVCLGWLFFRANTAGDAFAILAALRHWDWRPEYLTALQFLALFSLPLFLLDLRMARHAEEYPFENGARDRGRALTAAVTAIPLRKASYRRRIAVAICALLIVALFAGSNPNAFLYFQF